jgi:hypothetical protein
MAYQRNPMSDASAFSYELLIRSQYDFVTPGVRGTE